MNSSQGMLDHGLLEPGAAMIHSVLLLPWRVMGLGRPGAMAHDRLHCEDQGTLGTMAMALGCKINKSLNALDSVSPKPT